jgi:hypothetical protein
MRRSLLHYPAPFVDSGQNISAKTYDGELYIYVHPENKLAINFVA